MKSKMRGGSPAYDYHVTEGFLNNESTHLSNMPLTIHESGPVENYANLYQISGGGRRRSRGRRRVSRNIGSVQRSRRTSKRNTSLRLRRKNKRSVSRGRARGRGRTRSKRCGCQKLNQK
jgi:hypothetical protein